MADVNIIINQLRPYTATYKSIRKRQSIDDLIEDILYKHRQEEREADKVAKSFWMGNARATAQYLFDFCKQHLIYKEEGTENQSVKSLGAILIEKKVDCKNYALFIVSIVCALRRMGYPIAAKYRFAVYTDKPNAKGVKSGHVFAVVMDNGREIWCDPVVDNFDQRTPMYIKHTDKIPPMSGMSSTMGQVWDVTGIRNDTTLGGVGNDVTIGSHHHATYNYFKDMPLYEIPPVAVISLYKHLFNKHKRHGRHSLNRQEQAMLARLHHRFGLVADAHRAAGTEHQLHEAMVNAPTELPGRSASSYGSERSMNGVNVTRDEHGTLMERTITPGSTMGWIDEYCNRSDFALGKAKKHHAHKGLHIKINPGEVFKKINPALVTGRNAFLVLMKANIFHLASQIWDKAKHNADFAKKVDHFWHNLGGNTNKLHTALTQGTHVWNAHHPAHKISGYDGDYTMGVAGVDDAGYVAAIAAATPIIVKLSDLLKKAGINVPGKDQLDDAHQKLIKQHNDGTPNDDGSVTHDDGTTTNVTTDANGKKQLEISHAGDGGNDDGGDGGGDDDKTEKSTTKTKTKTTTKDEEKDDNGDDEEVTTKTKTKVTRKDKDGDGTVKVSKLHEFWDSAKLFVSEHKTWFIIGGIGVGVIIFLPPLLRMATGKSHAAVRKAYKR